MILPEQNAAEAGLINKLTVLPARHLLSVCTHLNGSGPLPRFSNREKYRRDIQIYPDLSDVHSHHFAKRALEICAAGGHNLLMVGPPGSGKTMLAGRLSGLLPPMSEEQGHGHGNDPVRQQPGIQGCGLEATPGTHTAPLGFIRRPGGWRQSAPPGRDIAGA